MCMDYRTPGHKLRIWMVERRLLVKEVAYDLDCSPNYLSRVCGGKQRPGRDLAVKIAVLTGDQVPYLDWQ